MSILNISISEFKKALNRRIEKGNSIYNEKIVSEEEYKILNSAMSQWDDYNRELLRQSFDNSENIYWKDYCNSGYTFLGDKISEVSGNPILTLKGFINDKLDNLKKLESKAELFKTKVVDTYTSENIFLKEKVFIVHGHDEEAKSKTARFIEKLGFSPIILHEQASSSKTIIEKIEEYSNVGFGIILYTPCDIGGKKNEKPILKSRARQNVVFEHGFLIGKIGRSNVCALVKDNVETPNDISGVVYIKMDEYNAWQFQIAKELKKAGYEFDMNKVL